MCDAPSLGCCESTSAAAGLNPQGFVQLFLGHEHNKYDLARLQDTHLSSAISERHDLQQLDGLHQPPVTYDHRWLTLVLHKKGGCSAQERPWLQSAACSLALVHALPRAV